MKCKLKNCNNESSKESDFVDGICRSCYEAGEEERVYSEGQ